MEPIARKIINCFNRGNKILICGNGGSSAQASHFSEELISHGFPAIALNDPQVLTALINDYGYDSMFYRYVEALGKPGDILLVFSTSGKSKNIIMALGAAKSIGMETIDFPRDKGKTTEEIQNEQLKLMHKIYRRIID